MSIKTLSIDEFLGMAGQKLGTSDWVTLGQERINEFADCTEDHQFIHIDQENAAKISEKKRKWIHWNARNVDGYGNCQRIIPFLP